MGHTTRCIPIAKSLLAAGYEVIFAVNETQKALLQKEGLKICFVHLPGYQIHYGKTKLGFALTLLAQVPKILWTIYQEHVYLPKLVSKHQIGLVISDNRYGMWHQQVPSIFITHQLHIQTGSRLLNGITRRINAWFINQYAACWVPDVAGPQNLAGILSAANAYVRKPVQYIGWLSKFLPALPAEPIYQFCFLISGPEPQRTQLEQWVKQLCTQLHTYKLVVFLGKPTATHNHSFGSNTTVYNHLPTRQMQSVLAQSAVIVCRSGYTTLMEMALLQKPCLVLPTIGQTEQEYLAGYLHQNNHCVAIEPATLQQADAFLQAANMVQQLQLLAPQPFQENDMPALLKNVLG